MVDEFSASINVWVEGACGELANSHELVHYLREVRAELGTIIRKDSSGASPARRVLIDQNAGCAGSCEVRGRNGTHDSVPGKSVGKEQDVVVALVSNWGRPKIVEGHNFARTDPEGRGDGRPLHSLTRRLVHLSLQTMLVPPAGAGVHAAPPVV